MNLYSHRSQAATEYLMTYGWAFLIIAIVAAILISLGVFSPSTSSTVTGFTSFTSASASVSKTNGLVLTLTNTNSNPIYLTNVSLSSSSGLKIGKVTVLAKLGSYSSSDPLILLYPHNSQITNISNNLSISPGQSFTIIISNVSAYSSYSTQATMTYYVNGIHQYAIGTISGTPVSSSLVPKYFLTVTFTESGLPSGTSWSVTYNGVTKSSTSSSIIFNATSTSESFSVPQVTTSTCTYNPSPSSGSIPGSSTKTISFTCLTVTFTESGLPSGTSWSVTYNGVTKSSTSSSIIFNATSTSESFSVPQVTTSTCTYNPSPSSGSIPGSSTKTISFSCIPTIFVINITNTQTVATPNPFQQMINVSSSSPVWSYINTNQTSAFGQNVEFIYPNGTVIPSWLESYSPTHAIWWIKIGSIPANSGITIFIKIAPKSTNLFNGVTVGEAPQLSSTYAEYDDGAKVFNYYTNFAGTSLPSGWVTTGNITINNGLTISGSSGPSQIETSTAYGSSVLDWFGRATEPTGSGYWANFGWYSSTSSGQGNGWVVYNSQSDYGYGYVTSNSVPTVTYTSTATNTNNVFSISNNGVTAYYYLNYNQQSTTYPMQTSSNYIAFRNGATSSGGGSTVFVQWVRVRAYPPNGVMPSASIV